MLRRSISSLSSLHGRGLIAVALLFALLLPPRATAATHGAHGRFTAPYRAARIYWERRLPAGMRSWAHTLGIAGIVGAMGAGKMPALPVDTTRSLPVGATTAGYARLLTRARDDALAARRATGVARATAIDRALTDLPPTLTVRVGGQDTPIDLTDIRDDLAAAPHNPRRLDDAITRLTALRAALDAPSVRATAPDARQLHKLDDILRRPPFVSSPNPWTSFLDWLDGIIANSPLGSILVAIGRFLHGLFTGGSGRTANWIALIIAGVIVAAALVFAGNRILRPFVPQADGPDDDLDAAGLTRVDAAGARARAAALATAGQYREAVRYRYLATLLTLDEAGRLRIDEATGNRDILRQARATPRLAEALAPVVRLFDLFLFGHVPVTRDDYEQYRELNERALHAPHTPQTSEAPR